MQIVVPIDEPYVGALSTFMPDGQPQTTPVWSNRTGDAVPAELEARYTPVRVQLAPTQIRVES